MIRKTLGLSALCLSLALATPARGQTVSRLFLEVRGGAVVPTFDIADVATTGGGYGGTLGYHLNNRFTVLGEFDTGLHQDKATSTVDITTRHYMAKLGYQLTPSRDIGWDVAVNLGAGAVSFKADVPNASTDTYFAINAGAKITYNFSARIGLVLSPQGDIAFSDKNTLGSSTAWVWPFSAGLRIKF